MKKIILLSLIMLMALSAMAEIKSGECGKNVRWEYNTETGKLIISGKGEMYDHHGSWPRDIRSCSISKGVTSIGEDAFSGCSGLTSITIPSSVTSIGDGAFWACFDLTKVDYKGTLEDWCKISFENRFSNPCSYAHHLYIGGRELKNAVIPSSVTSIGEDAFSGCSGLTSITIPSSVTSIGDYAFLDCDGLTSITIPSSVTSIGDYAFEKCLGLTSITIPSSVTSIGNGVFQNCCVLKSISVSPGNKKYDSRDNCNAIIETSTNTLISGCKNTIIPSSVTSIGNGAFKWCSRLTFITIPSSVTSIGEDAFEDCDGLTSITIPSSVTSIGNGAFEKCSNLKFIFIHSFSLDYEHEGFFPVVITYRTLLLAGCFLLCVIAFVVWWYSPSKRRKRKLVRQQKQMKNESNNPNSSGES